MPRGAKNQSRHAKKMGRAEERAGNPPSFPMPLSGDFARFEAALGFAVDAEKDQFPLKNAGGNVPPTRLPSWPWALSRIRGPPPRGATYSQLFRAPPYPAGTPTGTRGGRQFSRIAIIPARENRRNGAQAGARFSRYGRPGSLEIRERGEAFLKKGPSG